MAEQESLVNFTVQLPADIQSRAYSDGLTARKLTVALYDASDNELPGLTKDYTFAAGELTKTINLRLANSRSYKVAFWVQKEGAPYTFTTATHQVDVDYSAITANSDDYDAFYNTVDVTVNGSINQTVELRRPFAQINIGATDATEAADAGWITSKTSVHVDNVYSTLNLFNGDVSNAVSGGYTYTLAAKPAGETFPATTTPVAEYQSMVYVLTGADQSLTNVVFTAEPTTNPANVLTRTYTNVPVCRNYQTNIYGNILTEQANFTVQIVPGFKTPDYDNFVPDPGTAMVNGVQYSTLQEAVNAVSGTKVEVTVGAGSYAMPTIAAGKEVTFKGQGAGLTTMTYYNATGNYESFSVENMTFKPLLTSGSWVGVTHTDDVTFINAHVVGQLSTFASNFKAVNTTFENTTNYAVHVYGVGTATFEGCTFISNNGKAVFCYDETAVHHDMIFTNCTFTSSVARADKAPVQMHTEWGTYGTLTMTGCTATGFGDPHHNGDLWNDINNQTDVATTKFTVTINGTVVQTAH